MNEKKQAWFMLTLWRGTIPEFTSEVDAIITQSDSVVSAVHVADTADSSIDTTMSFSAQIQKQDVIGTDIITVSEVVWCVH